MLRPLRVLAAACLLLGTAGTPLVGADEPAYRLDDAFPGVTFARPVFAAQPPDATPRLFVVEQDGRVRIVDHPAPAAPAVASKRTFLDLAAKVSRRGNEEGLLGFAFHPSYAANGRFFVQYSAAYTTSAGRKNVLSEFRVSAGDPDAADAASERVIAEYAQPYENHNGGWIGFGPDGFLYVALGDGGAGGDPLRKGQDLSQPLAKILRIDVDGATPYAVPPTNPFVGRAGAIPETFAYGLRNPWRCSFDRLTGDLWVGDVGQDAFEEVDLVTAGGNYGWSRREAFTAFRTDTSTPADPLVDPLAAYGRDEGQSITGGYVYRGARHQGLAGAYLFADFVSGTIFTLRNRPGVVRPASAADVVREPFLSTGEQIASFAEDRDGEILVCSFGGRVLSLASGGAEPDPPFPPLLSEVGVFDDLPALVPKAGALPYAVRSPLWADGAEKSRFLVLPEGAPMTYAAEGPLALPVGALAVKTFTVRGARIETRVIRRDAGGFEAATYRWREDRGDADLVKSRTRIAVDARHGTLDWTLPSPADCRACHTDESGFLLGVTSRQIRAVRGGADLLRDWATEGLLEGEVPAAADRARSFAVGGEGRLAARVRSYLDANCASCHRPGAPLESGTLDLRAATPLAETGLFDTPHVGDLGIGGARIVAPGHPERSVLLERMRLRGAGQMPPLATSVRDAEALRAVTRWIRALR